MLEVIAIIHAVLFMYEDKLCSTQVWNEITEKVGLYD